MKYTIPLSIIATIITIKLIGLVLFLCIALAFIGILVLMCKTSKEINEENSIESFEDNNN